MTVVSVSDSTDTSAWPSQSIWGNCPIEEYTFYGTGYGFHDDFVNTPQMISDQDVAKYATYIDTGVTLTQTADGVGGVLGVYQDGTDNDEGWMEAGGNTGAPFLISTTAGSDKQLWFEARIKVNSIADDVCALFVGLAQEGLAAADTKVDNTGAFADKDFIGFNSVHVNGGTAGTNALVNFTYGKESGTQANLISSVHTLVANTWVKLGFIYQPARPAAKKIAVFVNGAEQTTYVTSTILADTTNFPAGQEMAPLLGTKAGTGTTSTLSVDWWRCYQAR